MLAKETRWYLDRVGASEWERKVAPVGTMHDAKWRHGWYQQRFKRQATALKGTTFFRRWGAGVDYERTTAARYMQLAQEKSLRDANLYLLRLADQLKRHDLNLTADDECLREWAEQKAALCRKIVNDERGRDDMGKLIACAVMADKYRFACPNYKTLGVRPVLARFQEAGYWRRNALRESLRAVEGLAVAMREVNRHQQVYVSDYTLTKIRTRREKNRKLLERIEATNQDGDSYTLAELAALSVSNPYIQRSELMVRIGGFEQCARWLGHVGLFLTLTCPSKYHGNSDKHAGAGAPTPRAAQLYLCKVFSRIRAALARRGIKLYDFRVAEPHNDGCPHWHFLVFADPVHLATIKERFQHYALQEDSDEPGAQKHRFTAVDIDPAKGTAAGYIAKYVAKNIDGRDLNDGDDLFSGYDVDALDGKINGRATDTAERIKACMSCWGVRQFQQLGGAPVGVWRELRRLDQEADDTADGDHDAHVRRWELVRPEVFSLSAQEYTDTARRAADASDWAAFTLVMGGVTVSRKDLRLRLARWLPGEDICQLTGEIKTNAYGDKPTGKLFGLVCDADTHYLTRPHIWTVELKAVETPELPPPSEYVRFMTELVLKETKRRPPARAAQGAAPPRSHLESCQ